MIHVQLSYQRKILVFPQGRASAPYASPYSHHQLSLKNTPLSLRLLFFEATCSIKKVQAELLVLLQESRTDHTIMCLFTELALITTRPNHYQRCMLYNFVSLDFTVILKTEQRSKDC